MPGHLAGAEPLHFMAAARMWAPLDAFEAGQLLVHCPQNTRVHAREKVITPRDALAVLCPAAASGFLWLGCCHGGCGGSPRI
ncbi:MAG: hypothetical protein MI749_06620 [Desulfovibrionales bacterium]|nr:hypothetical protein [Desulfovibrionales bacterium]